MMIIIFGAAVLRGGRPSQTLVRRVDAAFAFGGAAATYIPTGAIGRHAPSEASLMRSLLVSLGADPGRIICEETGSDTLSSAIACARLVGTQTNIYAASSGYHLPRCVMLLHLAGVPARRCPPPRQRWQFYWIFREAAALPWDWMLMWRWKLAHRPTDRHGDA